MKLPAARGGGSSKTLRGKRCLNVLSKETKLVAPALTTPANGKGDAVNALLTTGR